MKIYDVCGLGNGLVDILVDVSESQFQELKLEKGTMRLVDSDFQLELLNQFVSSETRLASGGSVANSIIAASQLGARGGFICCLGDDRYGEYYRQEFEKLGIRIMTKALPGEMTGTCVALITPDAERTMRTSLGASVQLSKTHVLQSDELIKSSRWLFIEGYVFCNPKLGIEAIRTAVQIAKRSDTKVALTFSEAFVIDSHRAEVEQVVQQSVFLFANESEACAFAKQADVKDAFSLIKSQVRGCAVTCGEKGAFVSFEGRDAHIDAYPCSPVDLTGAGDMFAGVVLASICRGIAIEDAGKAGCCLAREVITRYGARLQTGAPEAFRACLGRDL